eukprot:scaffold34922_cov141-Amphora_coffeaeformis.AAC.3
MPPSPPPDADHRKRPLSSVAPTPPAKRPAIERSSTPSKPYKGLRHFSMMVCKKVEEKGTTSYNEVADELVQHVIAERKAADPDTKCDEKNIRRRVYDALNVLMAMDIIQKDKKAISWRGLPTSAHADLEMLGREREFRVCFRNLLTHNQQQPPVVAERTIPLPFIVVNTHSSAVIQCNMSRELTDVAFEFSQPFEINDDNTILKRLEMHRADHGLLRSIFPEDLVQYAGQHGLLQEILEPAGHPPAAMAATSDYMPPY